MAQLMLMVNFTSGRVPVPDARFDFLCEHYKPMR
jgi:hypothetical protein